MPLCDLYDGSRDPGEHVYQFQTNMLLLQVSDTVMCWAFPTTLRKVAHAWFKSLRPRSIHSFAQLSDLFQKHFVSSRTQRKNSTSFLNVVQERNESLSRYLGRFNAATLEINNLDESVKYTAFMRGLRPTTKFAFAQKKEPATTISFSDDDVGDTRTPHDDPLVVTLRVGNFDVKRILVDNGSSAEVLFYEAFQRMNIPSDRLRKIDTPLYGFSNHPVVCEGIIALPVTVALNQLRAVVSTYHMKMKFPTENGVGEVKGDQAVARQCYMASCQNRANETLMIEDLRDETKVERGKPAEDLFDIELYSDNQEKIVRVRT
ncbi:hypothetical protein RJ639_000053 [Escallonia herrerae]|uniref:Retrotransposon gag domain-containing protein n=1 Tax=Escallonia herrerae TaxID=1293975 RepID=A0AA89BNY1_9ASTE|nr:hypothetical protein RJ639_000053 [Escallonia herrerae]